ENSYSSMKIRISEIPEDGVEFDLREEVSSEAIKILSPVHARIRIDKEGLEVFIKGYASGDVEQQCSRCLGRFNINVTSQIDVVYHPAKDIKREYLHELKSDELNTGFYGGDIFDTDDLLREELLLCVPMKPLCSVGCKGLCPKCGANLNIAECNCAIYEIDSRLSVLKQLLR
ncbi:DUF177 domain-containing protein, partial [Thermodesulfovibrionales bacterium]|nr:DUF177 domain-containing protein [Thermodesulfovibrionales bacterium]